MAYVFRTNVFRGIPCGLDTKVLAVCKQFRKGNESRHAVRYRTLLLREPAHVVYLAWLWCWLAAARPCGPVLAHALHSIATRLHPGHVGVRGEQQHRQEPEHG